MNRNQILIQKVGKYYFLYRERLNINKVLSNDLMIQNAEEVVKSYIILSLFRDIILNVIKEFKKAVKDELTHREFTTNFDKEIYGALDVPRTIITYSQGLYAYYSFREGRNAPEYAILNYLLRRIYEIAKEYMSRVNENLPEENYFSKKIKKINEEINRLEEYLNYFKGEYFRPITSYDPKWLINVYEYYKLMLELERTEIGIKGEIKMDKKMIKVLLWKLYEIYVFFLFVKYLESKGYEISDDRGGFLVSNINRKFYLYLNSSLSTSLLEKIDDFSSVEEYRGRPDLALNNSVIVECKYSTNVSYITASRFKIMAYAYEYDPMTVILAYPGLEDKDSTRGDKEEVATRELDKYVKERGFVDFSFRNGKKLFMVRLDPLIDDEKNISILDRIFTSYPTLYKFMY